MEHPTVSAITSAPLSPSVDFADFNLGALGRRLLFGPDKTRAALTGPARDYSDALMDSGVVNNHPGVALPCGVLAPRGRSLSMSNAGALNLTKRAPVVDFTDVLRSRAVVAAMGGRFVSLFGGDQPIVIPSKQTGASAAWIGDGAPAPATDFQMTDDPEPGASKTVAATILVSRKLWNGTDDAVHSYIVDEMGAAIAVAVDRAVVAGPGGLAPTGLLSLAGVPSGSFGANGGPPTRAALVAAMKAVGNADGDASATASMGWITSPDGEAKLRLTDGSTAGAGSWLWSDSGRILGKPAASTTSVPNDLAKGSGTGLTALAYGNWADVLVNHAPHVWVMIDRHTHFDGGVVRIVAFLDVKVVFRHKAAFHVFKDMATN
jgi:HK97 family phage major capsid protein